MCNDEVAEVPERRGGGMRSVEREVELPVAPVEAWPWVTGGTELGEWFDAEVDLDARPNGHGRFRFADGSERLALVERVEPATRFEFRWWPAGDHADATRVAITLEPSADGTRVRVTETRLRAATGTRGPLLACA
jgi:hypothetical protein